MITINLLPWREEQAAQRKQQFVLCIGLGVGASFMLVMVVHFILAYQIKKQDQLNDQLRTELSLLDSKLIEINSLEKEKANLVGRMEVIQTLQNSRQNTVRLFDNITRSVPKGLYLTSLNRTGSQLLMEGQAESNTRVSKFMRNIEASTWLSHPQLSVIQANEQERNQEIGFSLQAVQTQQTEGG